LPSQAAQWATPAQRDYRHPNAKPYAERGGGKKGEQLNNQVAHGQTPNGSEGGALNPEFVSWLMGFPDGWLNLEPSEMP
jgi:DNA (cytosine-5)-methyltransferase 1